MMKILKMFLFFVFLCSNIGFAADKTIVKIVGEPKVSKAATGTGYNISFAISKPVDVTIRIVDKGGNVVRHLVSGIVGAKNSPKPFSDKNMNQNVLWDGKDDDGKIVKAEDCKVFIGAGLNPKFDKFISYNPDAFDSRSKIIQAPDNEYYVTEASSAHQDVTRVFSADGKLLRSLWPYSLNKPKEIIEGLMKTEGAEDWDGNAIPSSINQSANYYFATRYSNAIVTTDGYMIGVTTEPAAYICIFSMDPNGFPHTKISIWGPPWHKALGKERIFAKDKWRLAAGNNGDFYLADSIHHAVGHFKAKDMSPINDFTSSGNKKLGSSRCYIGEVDQTGDNESLFTGPDDIVVDKNGNLLIADGNTVKVYDKTGKYLSKSEKPRDFNKPVIPKPLLDCGRKEVLVFPHFLLIDNKGKIYVKNASTTSGPYVTTDIEGKSFKTINFPWGYSLGQGYSAVDLQGNFYMTVHKGQAPVADFLWKFNPDGSRAKFGNKDQIDIEDDVHEIKGVRVTKNGDIYLGVLPTHWKPVAAVQSGAGRMGPKGDNFNITRVDVYDSNGNLKKKGVVNLQAINDVAVDRDGNIYAMDGTMWHGAQTSGAARAGTNGWPPYYIAEEEQKLDPVKHFNRRFSILQRLLKFAPAGGSMDSENGPKQLWTHKGVSGLSPEGCGGECPGGQIFIDDDQRVWVPDTYIYNIKAVDTEGNLIARVGKYGNEDCKGGGGDKKLAGTNIIIDPEIPVARPSGIAVYKDYLFISDMYAHRIVRCKLEYSDKKEIVIK